MWWMILVVVAYIPIFYRIHRRINELEAEVERLKNELE
jgi:hypothetical protein